MATVAMIDNPIPEEADRKAVTRPTWQARYLATLDGAAALDRLERRRLGAGGLAAGPLPTPRRGDP
ncbi:MAG: hypothetical protein AB7I30_00525 [Isosphaeraceae bacterium]